MWLKKDIQIEVGIVVSISGELNSVEIAGKDTLGKTVNNLAQMRGLVIFVLDYATAVLMKYVMDALVALLKEKKIALLRRRVFREI